MAYVLQFSVAGGGMVPGKLPVPGCPTTFFSCLSFLFSFSGLVRWLFWLSGLLRQYDGLYRAVSQKGVVGWCDGAG